MARAPEQQICSVDHGEGQISNSGISERKLQVVCKSRMVTDHEQRHSEEANHAPFAYSETIGADTSTEWFSEGCKW